MTLSVLAATPLPIHVADTVRIAAQTDWGLFWMMLFGTLASAAVAIFTAVLAARTNALATETKRMADKTADLAVETLDSIKVARSGVAISDRHHQESLSPVLVLGDLVCEYHSQSSAERGVAVLLLSASVANIGFGPAVDIVLTVWLDGKVAEGTIEFPPLAASESRPTLVYTVTMNKMAVVPLYPRVGIKLNYMNVFGGERFIGYQIAEGDTTRPGKVSEAIYEQGVVARTLL